MLASNPYYPDQQFVKDRVVVEVGHYGDGVRRKKWNIRLGRQTTKGLFRWGLPVYFADDPDDPDAPFEKDYAAIVAELLQKALEFIRSEAAKADEDRGARGWQRTAMRPGTTNGRRGRKPKPGALDF